MSPDKLNKPVIPFYVKATAIIVGAYYFIDMLYLAQSIVVPLLFATIIAILLSNVVDFFVRKKMNRVLAIAITMLVALVTTASFLVIISLQFSMFTDSLPQFNAKFKEMIEMVVAWASDYFNVSVEEVNAWIDGLKKDLMANKNTAIGYTLNTLSSVLVVLFLIPVLIFLVLFYKPHIKSFIFKLFGNNNQAKVSEILVETKSIIQSYLAGLLLETGIVATLNSVGLLILGVEYALLLGILGAILNLIPYIGGIIAVAMPMLIALVTKSPIFSLYVLLLYMVIQFVDNNYIVPKIVGSKVKINALVCIVAVLLGGTLWGVSGMFLSIPMTAIIKLIFDRLQPLRPWGFLLGDPSEGLVPDHTEYKIWTFIKRIFSKKKTQ